MKKIRFGVMGAGRGMAMIRQLMDSNDATLVAICDQFAPALENAARFARNHHQDVQLFSDFDEFLTCSMDAIVLANFATEHAPYAIRCMEAGLHVYSEVLPVQTMQEAVALIETAEKTGKIYAYAENYCYMPAPYEMRRLYRAGKIGTFEYGEGEYMHNCEPGWHRYTQGRPNHWRNSMYATYYCTHSIGPLIHITGLRPVSVSAFELPFNERMARMGARAGSAAVEIVTLENGSIIKSLHGVGCARNSVWYSIYGSEGRLESAREDAENGGTERLYTSLTERNSNTLPHTYTPQDAQSADAAAFAHGGSDYYALNNFIRKLQGCPDADIIDVYEAMDMFLPGIFGYRSILAGGAPMELPDLRIPAVRERFRHDVACTDPAIAGHQLLPSYSKGTPVIPEETYRLLQAQFQKEIASRQQQLKLIFFPQQKPLHLPDGYRVTQFTGADEEIADWVEICKQGLVADDAGPESFERAITSRPYIDPLRDVFFLIAPDGRRVGTVTAIDNYDGIGMGGVHMVAVHPDSRGQGLSHILCRIAENKLFRNHIRIARLTTDEWRKGACKAYLDAGWYPVNYDEDMVARWTSVITALGISSVMMLTDDGAPDRLLTTHT